MLYPPYYYLLLSPLFPQSQVRLSQKAPILPASLRRNLNFCTNSFLKKSEISRFEQVKIKIRRCIQSNNINLSRSPLADTFATMNYNENCVIESSSSTEVGTSPPGAEMLYPHTFGQGDSQYSSSILANIPSLPGMMSQQLAPTLYHNNASAASAASTSSAEGMVPVGLLAYWQQQALRLQQQVQNSKQKGRGRNKRNHHQNATDLSNKTAVRLVTRNQIWPKHKLLNIKGNFKQYDPTKLHAFPKFMMRQVSVRDGDEARYYEDEVLPEVSATLSICRNNTVKEMKKAFKG